MTTASGTPTPLRDSQLGRFALRALRREYRSDGQFGALQAELRAADPTTVHYVHPQATDRTEIPLAGWVARSSALGMEHDIFLNRLAAKRALPNVACSARLINSFHRQLLRHEAWHARLTLDTYSTSEKLADALRADGLSFDLFNLFEDARIEGRARLAPLDKINGRKFGWKRFLSIASTDRPADFFNHCITNEAVIRTTFWTGRDSIIHPDTGTKWSIPRLIQHFYTRARIALTSGQLFPLIAEWQRVFKTDAEVSHPTGRVVGTVINTGRGTGYSATRGTDDGSVHAPTTYTTEAPPTIVVPRQEERHNVGLNFFQLEPFDVA